MMAKHSSTLEGVDALAILPPYYHQPTTVSALISTMKMIAEAVPNQPLFYYHFPEKTGVTVSMTEFCKRAKTELPTLVGLKWTDENLLEFGTLQDMGFNMLNGKDSLFLPFLTVGAQGFVGANYNFNFAAPLFLKIIKAFNEGDIKTAMENYKIVRLYYPLIKQYNGIAAVKGIMKVTGIDVGEPRMPLEGLTQAELEKVKTVLTTLGLFHQTTAQ